MEKKVRIGILGCANIAGKYAIKAFQSIDNAEVISIASRDFNKAKEWADKFGIKAEQSYESLISSNEIDAVYIPLPNGLHKEWILKAAANHKHIICEKSLAGDFVSVKEAVDSCKVNNVILYENFMCNFHPQHEKVLSLMAEGNVGLPFIFQGYFGFPPLKYNDIRYQKELGGGSLNDIGAYTVFMSRKIFAEEPISVTSNLFYENDVDMKGSAQLEFRGGKIGLLGFSFNAVYQNNYSVWGTKGLLKVHRAYGIPPDMKPIVDLYKNENLKESLITIDIPAANQFELVFWNFCNTILTNDKIKIQKSYDNIILQAKVLEAIRISAKENKKVFIGDIN